MPNETKEVGQETETAAAEDAPNVIPELTKNKRVNAVAKGASVPKKAKR